jgi:hypothetical protein
MSPGRVCIYKNDSGGYKWTLVGFVFIEMTVEATNGPLVGFVFTKMPLKATNSPPKIVLWALGYVIGP